ncbi:peptidoglycan D,D-transpeptidase FtsI family protein [Rickettsiales bacterium LUAb2]
MYKKLKSAYKYLLKFKFNKQNRLNVIIALTVVLFIFVCCKLILISVLGEVKNYSLYLSIPNYSNLTLRHDITDRNGNVLAVTIPSTSVYLRPKDIVDKDLAVKALSVSFNLSEKAAKDLVDSKYPFVWVKRNVSDKELQSFLKFGVIGAYLENGYRRFYPYGNYFSHVVGVTNIDGKGISGIESSFDQELSKNSVQLSLDVRLQVILREALQDGLKNNQAKHAFGIIVNPNNGEVLAMSSLPDFNPNNRDTISMSNMFNYVTQGVFEQGSTFKFFTIASALDSNIISVDDTFDVSKPIVMHKYVLVDDKYLDREINVPEILIYSSDIASALIAMKMGDEIHEKYFSALGLFGATSLEIPEKAASVGPKNWKTLTQITLSYGYGMAVSQATEANAIAALINGGYYIPMTLLKRNDDNYLKTRVVKPETSLDIRRMARLIVSQGTGRVANVKGYNVGGKTGSAEKIDGRGGYDHNKLFSSLVAFFPAEKPKYLIFVSIDEPKRLKYNSWNITGSMVSGPVIAEIVKNMGSLLGIPKEDDGADNINRNHPQELLDFVERTSN